MSKKPDIFVGDESLEREAPLLHSISKENPFSVPENYFDALPSQIIEKCQEKVVSSQWSIVRKTFNSYFFALSSYKWRLFAVTGCMAVICFFAIRLNQNNRPISYQALAKNIPDSLIVAHFDNNISDISIYSLEDLQAPENNSNSVKVRSDSASADQDIIAYLMNNNVSVSDIENE